MGKVGIRWFNSQGGLEATWLFGRTGEERSGWFQDPPDTGVSSDFDYECLCVSNVFFGRWEYLKHDPQNRSVQTGFTQDNIVDREGDNINC